MAFLFGALLAWHLLTTGLPYRYAKPDAVAGEFAKLCVTGSGKQHTGGVPKGVDAGTMRPAAEQNQHRTHTPNDVLASEGLSAPSRPSEAADCL